MLVDPKVNLLRQFRDTRFSEDKTPLKSHLGATFPNRALGRMNGAGFYFEVAPGWVWIGGGLWRPDTSQLQLVREHIVDNLREAREDRQFAGASRNSAACRATG